MRTAVPTVIWIVKSPPEAVVHKCCGARGTGWTVLLPLPVNESLVASDVIAGAGDEPGVGCRARAGHRDLHARAAC